MPKKFCKRLVQLLCLITCTVALMTCDGGESPYAYTNPKQTFPGYSGLNPDEDTDSDGLTNILEDQLGTDPLDYDTDDDGLVDGPAGSEDQNGNGIIDSNETDLTNPDTDGDTIPDGTELGLDAPTIISGLGGTNLAMGNFRPDMDPTTQTNPLKPDTDGDTIPDGAEDSNRNGKVDPGETNPSKPDTDDDGIVDGLEIANGTDPTNPDTDDDGIVDGLEITNGTDPTNPDTDGDGLWDGEEVDFGSNPLLQDTDGDGIFDDEEYTLGTDPTLVDTDGDGYSDSEEVDAGTNPLDIFDYPVDELIWVGKSSQAQCDTYCEDLSIAFMEAQMAGVTILNSTAGTYQGFYLTVCGGPTGFYNFFQIYSSDLSKLNPTGWTGWTGPMNESLIIPGLGCGGMMACFPEDPCCDPFSGFLFPGCISIWP